MLKFRWETKFKQTEIGEIAEEWEVRKLGEIAIIESGGNAPQKEKYFMGGRFPFIRVKHLCHDKYLNDFDLITQEAVKDFNLKLYKKGAIVFPRSGESIRLSKCNVLPFDSYVVNHLAVIENKDGLSEKDFLYYSLIIFNKLIEEEIAGTTLPYLRNRDIQCRNIVYPSLAEQSRIATVLSWFDELIENKKRQNEVLEKTAIAIFKSWFIGFEPFKDEKFVESELGEIPEGWEVKALNKVCELIKGVSYNSPDISPEPQGSLFITLNNFLRGGGFKAEYNYYIGGKAKDSHKVKDGDLIVALTDMTSLARVVGAPATVVLPYGYESGIISLDCAKIEPINKHLKIYLYLYLKYSQEENSTFANGVNVLHLNTKLFMRNKLVITPPQPILQKFHFLVEPLFQKILTNQKQIMVLRKIRDALLPLLVFGKLRVEKI